MYSKKFLKEKIKMVNDYWIKENPESGDSAWERGAYMIGNVAAYEMTEDKNHLNYAIKWAEDNDWKLYKQRNKKETAVNANSMLCGESYLKLLMLCNGNGTDKYIIEETDNLSNNSENDDWWWIDTVYMAFPFMQEMCVRYGNDRYAEKAHNLFEYMRLERGLYDAQEHLWYRDERFTPDKELTSNGKKIFWARGNGWVFAGLARGLSAMDKDNKYYDEYSKIFCDMAESIRNCVNSDGGFTTSLFDKEEFPLSETSGTALFTLGFLIGVRLGLLDESYLETAFNGFEWLNRNAIDKNGRIGYVQGVSWGPDMAWAKLSDEDKKINSNDYAVGTYLLICSELWKICS